jgi:hypothetical protein
MPERFIEKLEAGSNRRNMSSAVTARADAQVILVESLNCGLRRMVEAMIRDTQLMAKAETFLASKL